MGPTGRVFLDQLSLGVTNATTIVNFSSLHCTYNVHTYVVETTKFESIPLLSFFASTILFVLPTLALFCPSVMKVVFQ